MREQGEGGGVWRAGGMNRGSELYRRKWWVKRVKGRS